MLIEEVELRIINMKLVSPFETSFGRETERKAIIVKMASEGLEGYGECVAMDGPWYSYETVETAWIILQKFMIPMILGKEISLPSELLKLLGKIRGHNMARAALEEAFWDLYAKFLGKPLSKLLGGVKDKIESGVSIGIQENVQQLLRVIDNYLSEGYKRIKLKIKPSWDIKILREVRKHYPDIPLMVDANAAYTINDTPHLKKLDDFNLLMIEQPLSYDDLVDHANLQNTLKTPICLDESIKTLSDARAAIKLGSCKIINIKVGRVGGLLNAKKIHDLCQANDIPVWCGGMLETGIGRAINVAIASLPNFKLPNDISASKRYYEEDIIEPPFELNEDGTINVPKGPGIGVEVVEERIKKRTIKEFTIKRKATQSNC